MIEVSTQSKRCGATSWSNGESSKFVGYFEKEEPDVPEGM
jgi:hypothetical protein